MRILASVPAFEMFDEPPDMSPCVKRQTVPCKAVQINTPFIVNTYEGVQKGKPGDYLMKGAEGENYVCDQAVFDKTYTWLLGQ